MDRVSSPGRCQRQWDCLPVMNNLNIGIFLGISWRLYYPVISRLVTLCSAVRSHGGAYNTTLLSGGWLHSALQVTLCSAVRSLDGASQA